MSLKEKLSQDMKDAMRAGDKPRLGVIRLILAAVKQQEVDQRIELEDSQIITTLDKMAKQRRESIEQFSKAGRDELVAQETFELEVIKTYLPEQLSDAEIDTLIADAISSCSAESIKDMGKVMGQLKPKLQGRADMSAVSGKIRQKLNS